MASVMKTKFLVMRLEHKKDDEVARYDKYEEAEGHIHKTPSDLMGTVEFYILKIFTNSDK